MLLINILGGTLNTLVRDGIALARASFSSRVHKDDNGNYPPSLKVNINLSDDKPTIINMFTYLWASIDINSSDIGNNATRVIPICLYWASHSFFMK